MSTTAFADMAASSSPQAPRTSETVIIVGAGLAGLSCAADLTAAGVHTVVLEAQERIGGRVRSIRLPSPSPRKGPLADLGAAYYHGVVDNVAYSLAVEHGLTKRVSVREHLSSSLFSNKNDEVQERSLMAFLLRYPCTIVRTDGTIVFEKAGRQAREIALSYTRMVETKPEQCISMASHHEEMLGTPMNDRERSVRALCAGFDSVLNGGAAEKDICARHIHDFVELTGPDLAAGPEGMGGLVTALRGRVDGDVHMGKVVRRVEWGDGKACVVTEKGERFDGCAVVWTGSLTVTKAAVANGVFQPGLPDTKIDALERVGMDAMEKVFAVLRYPLKYADDDMIAVLWEDGGNSGLKGWERGIHVLSWDKRRQAVVFFLCGDDARSFLQTGEEQRREETQRMLRKLLPNDATTGVLKKVVGGRGDPIEVDAVECGEWSNNAFVGGAYSYPRVGRVEGDVGVDGDVSKRLAAALPDEETATLCFAGEMTHDKFHSTMHGAIESGRREAARLMKVLSPSRTG